MSNFKYEDYENIKKIEEKIRYCKFCGKNKLIRYEIDETEHDKNYDIKTNNHIHPICDGCLHFITEMDRFAQTS